jgi:hypothetical protein
MEPGIKPATILRHAYGIYPSLAMLAGMQLDLFTPLKDGGRRFRRRVYRGLQELSRPQSNNHRTAKGRTNRASYGA